MGVIRQARYYIRNPSQLEPIKNLVEQCLERLLPADAHKRCSGQLGVSVTKVSWPNGGNKFISEFHSRRDLIEAICAGCFIPLWSGSLWGPKFRGETYIDGACSNNKPKFELDNHRHNGDMYGLQAGHLGALEAIDSGNQFRALKQIELSPFAGEIDVSPKDHKYWTKMRAMGTVYLFNWNNLVRSSHAMFPFKTLTYLQYLKGGHSDMKDYLFRNNLIKCEQCFLHQETKLQTVIRTNNMENLCFEQQLAHETTFEEDLKLECYRTNSCIFCLKLLEQVDGLRVPDELQKIMLND